MRHTPLHQLILGLVCSLLALAAGNLQAAGLSPAEQLQLFASRATNSLLLLRGEGFQDDHLQRLERDIADLERATRSIGEHGEGLAALSAGLVTQLRLGVSFGPKEDNMPWDYPQHLAQALRDLLSRARSLPPADSAGELPAKIEYLAVQYLSRAYIGNFEIAREHPDSYVGQDERVLVPAIDRELQALARSNSSGSEKLQTRWKFLRAALLDMNSGSNALASASGRAFAPTMVDRHARAMSGQWVSLVVSALR